MVVTFWGVRGSTPAPGADTVRYGGHTACVSVRLDDRLLVLDAGTGIRALGEALMQTDEARVPITILLTHLHTDHISGFPFFAPLYDPEQCIELIDYPIDEEPWSLLSMLDGLHFPLETSDISSVCRQRMMGEDDVLADYGVTLQCLDVTHPGGAYGYRLTYQGRSFVYIPDHEINAPVVTTPRADVVAFCRGADVLCHDAQYLQSEIADRRGWGHSTVEAACDLAADAEVGRLVLFHHDPKRSDDALDRIADRARHRLQRHSVDCSVAHQGLTLPLDEPAL